MSIITFSTLYYFVAYVLVWSISELKFTQGVVPIFDKIIAYLLLFMSKRVLM